MAALLDEGGSCVRLRRRDRCSERACGPARLGSDQATESGGLTRGSGYVFIFLFVVGVAARDAGLRVLAVFELVDEPAGVRRESVRDLARNGRSRGSATRPCATPAGSPSHRPADPGPRSRDGRPRSPAARTHGSRREQQPPWPPGTGNPFEEVGCTHLANSPALEGGSRVGSPLVLASMRRRWTSRLSMTRA
jgi:hypothetical protein